MVKIRWLRTHLGAIAVLALAMAMPHNAECG